MSEDYIINSPHMEFSNYTQEILDADSYIGDIQELISERVWRSTRAVYLHLIYSPGHRERFEIEDATYDMDKDIATFSCCSDVEKVKVEAWDFSKGYNARKRTGIPLETVIIRTHDVAHNINIKIV